MATCAIAMAKPVVTNATQKKAKSRCRNAELPAVLISGT
jgi:hypothetical protein